MPKRLSQPNRKKPRAKPSARAQRRATRTASSRPAPSSAERTLDDSPSSQVEERAPSAIVAVGASAGGLEAFSQVLSHLDQNPDIAFVFVQHLSPQHASALPELLSPRTSLAVVQASDGATIEPNH